MSEPGKDELARYERWWERDGRSGARLLSIILMAGIVIIPAIGVASERLLGLAGSIWLMAGLIALLLAVATVLVLKVRRARGGKFRFAEPLAAHLADQAQHRRWRSLLWSTVWMGAFLAFELFYPGTRSDSSFSRTILILMAMAWGSTALGLLCGFFAWGWGSILGPFMNDELAIQHRARALRAGFLVLLAGSVLMAIATWFVSLHWLRIGTAGVAYLGFATAAIRFALLERAAEKNG